jgi:hypothetical protein
VIFHNRASFIVVTDRHEPSLQDAQNVSSGEQGSCGCEQPGQIKTTTKRWTHEIRKKIDRFQYMSLHYQGCPITTEDRVVPYCLHNAATFFQCFNGIRGGEGDLDHDYNGISVSFFLFSFFMYKSVSGLLET